MSHRVKIRKWGNVMVKKYRVGLPEEEQQELKSLVFRGREAA